MRFVVIVIYMALAAATPLAAQGPTTTQADNIVARQRLRIGTDTAQYLTSIVRIISKAAATHRQSPTAKAVVDYCNRFIEVVGNPTTGDCIKWDGTKWVPAPDLGGGSPIINGTLEGAGTTPDPLRIAQQGATTGEVLKWDGTTWRPASDDNTGTTYTPGTGIGIIGSIISNTGDTNPTDDITTASTAAGDVTGPFGNLQIAQAVVGTTELSDDAVTASKLGPMGATTGQIMKWNGTDWVPSADGGSAGVTTNATLSGLGTSGSPLQIAQQGAVSGSVLRWIGSTWVPTALTTVFESGSFGSVIMENNEAMNVGMQIGANNGSVYLTNPNLGGGVGISGSTTGNRLEATATNLSAITHVSDSVAYSALKAIGTAPNTHRQLGMFVRRRLLTTSTPNYIENEYKTSAATWRQRLIFPDRESNITYTLPEYSGEAVMASSTVNPTTGQVLKWDGTNYVPGPDQTGTSYTAGTGISLAGDVVTNTGDTNANDDITTASTAGGDVTGVFSNLQIAANSVGTTEIADGSIGLFEMAQDGAVEGDVRMWSGTEWFHVPALTTTGLNDSPTITLNALGGNAFSASIAQQGANEGNSLVWSAADSRYRPDLSISTNRNGLLEFSNGGQYGNIGYYGLNAGGIEFIQDNGGFVSLVSNGTSYFNKIHGANASEGSFNIFFDTLTTSLLTSANDKHHLTMLVSETRAHLVHRYQPGTTPYEHKIFFGDFEGNRTYRLPNYSGEFVLKSTVSPNMSDVLSWNGSTWTPSAPTGGGVTTVGATILATNANGASITGSTINMHRADDINPGVIRLGGDLDGDYNTPQVDGLRGRVLDNSTPAAGQQYRITHSGTSFTSAYPNDIELAVSHANDFAAITFSDPFFTIQNSGTGAGTTSTVATQANQVGIASMSTGTTATGSTRVITSSSVTLGSGKFEYKALNVQFPTLTDGVQTYQFVAGLYDGTTAANIVDGVFFRYSTANAAWQAVTRSNSAETATNTTTIVAAAYYDLEIVVNASATSADFYINNNLVATHTLNIPSGAVARQTGCGIGLFKTAGTTASTCTVDAIQFAYSLAR